MGGLENFRGLMRIFHKVIYKRGLFFIVPNLTSPVKGRSVIIGNAFQVLVTNAKTLGGVAEWSEGSGLENRRKRRPTVGSNPTPSAPYIPFPTDGD